MFPTLPVTYVTMFDMYCLKPHTFELGIEMIAFYVGLTWYASVALGWCAYDGASIKVRMEFGFV